MVKAIFKVCKRQCVPLYSSKFSRKDFTLWQHIALLALMQRIRKSYREYVNDYLTTTEKLVRTLRLSELPHFTSIEKFLLRVPSILLERVLGGFIRDGEDQEPGVQQYVVKQDKAIEYLASLIPAGLDFSAFRLVVDCANGSACRVVPLLLARLGMHAEILNAEPNGRNINLNCGSLHPEMLVETTRAAGADLGVAFDGDADRAMFATRQGRAADGDHVLYAIAPFLHRQGNLKGAAVVARR